MNRKLIVDIRFNIDLRKYGELTSQKNFDMQAVFDRAQTSDWIFKRMALFRKLAFTSLINQTSQNFTCVIRYEKSSEQFIKQAMDKYSNWPKNFIFTSDADALIANEFKTYDYLYQIGMDTDHYYDPHFIETLEQFPYTPGLQCLLCRSGYLYDTQAHRLAEIYHPSPSCYAYIYDQNSFKSDFQKRTYQNHVYARDLNFKELVDRHYMLVVHGQNVYHNFDLVTKAYKGNIISDPVAVNNILNSWSFSNPIR